ncbi:hypothetical protein [Aureimonas sp. AU40]|uniref:hypothetical protein n=1 Tax=Aureimonas sp. AU40 TaxID=1637747 RepID=UPI000785DF68|nr:hypothetical protein [Aureimonas sp. AU40]
MTRTASLNASASIVARFADAIELADAFKVDHVPANIDADLFKRSSEGTLRSAGDRFRLAIQHSGLSPDDMPAIRDQGMQLVEERKRIRREEAAHRAAKREAALASREEREYA